MTLPTVPTLLQLKRQAYSLGLNHEIARQYGDLRFRATWEKAIADQPNVIAAEVAIAEQSLSTAAPQPSSNPCELPQPEPEVIEVGDVVFNSEGVRGVVKGFIRSGRVLVYSIATGRTVLVDRGTISKKRPAPPPHPAAPLLPPDQIFLVTAAPPASIEGSPSIPQPEPDPAATAPRLRPGDIVELTPEAFMYSLIGPARGTILAEDDGIGIQWNAGPYEWLSSDIPSACIRIVEGGRSPPVGTGVAIDTTRPLS